MAGAASAAATVDKLFLLDDSRLQVKGRRRGLKKRKSARPYFPPACVSTARNDPDAAAARFWDDLWPGEKRITHKSWANFVIKLVFFFFCLL